MARRPISTSRWRGRSRGCADRRRFGENVRVLGGAGALGVAVVLRPFWLVFLAYVLLAATTLRGL
jgi:hypothetical protein